MDGVGGGEEEVLEAVIQGLEMQGDLAHVKCGNGVVGVVWEEILGQNSMGEISKD